MGCRFPAERGTGVRVRACRAGSQQKTPSRRSLGLRILDGAVCLMSGRRGQKAAAVLLPLLTGLEQDPQFDFLRGSSEFQALLEEYGAK